MNSRAPKPVSQSYEILATLIERIHRTPKTPVSLANRPLAHTLCRTDGASRAWWVARWLLVLVLAFDHLSAPFHFHYHDGVEGQQAFGAAHASFDDGDAHVDSDEHSPFSHSATALRTDPLRLGQLPAIDGADLPVALISVAQLLAALDEPPPTHWRPDRARPDFRSHRSLPPAGRAPPLHV